MALEILEFGTTPDGLPSITLIGTSDDVRQCAHMLGERVVLELLESSNPSLMKGILAMPVVGQEVE